jgi:cohesin complex subunit SA-1/2
MESSDPATPDTSVDMNTAADRRKSGRARQKPVLLNKDPNIAQVSIGSSGKRKRANTRVDEVEDPNDLDEEESSHNESDPDEEELKEQRRRESRSKKRNSTKPTAKKHKTGPTLTTNLAVRPAVNGAKKAAKPKQPRARPIMKATNAETGLYGLFAHDG